LVKQTKDSSYGYGKAFPMKGWAGRIVGFVGDVLLDPLTYATLGATISKKATMLGVDGVTRIGTREAIFGATKGAIKTTAGREGRETLAQFSQKRMTHMLNRGDTFGGEVVTADRIMGITRDIAAKGKSAMPEWLNSELGIRGPGIYYFGSRVRVPGTGTIGKFLEKGLVDTRLASVNHGGPIAKIQEMLAPHGIFPDERGVKMAHINLARGKMSPEKAELALNLLESQTKYRIAVSEFGDKSDKLLNEFINSEVFGKYAGSMHQLLDQVIDEPAVRAKAVTLGLPPEAADAALVYRSYMDQLIDEVDQRMLTIDPTWETGNIATGYFPRFETEEMKALRLKMGNAYFDDFMGKPGFSIGSNYNSRTLLPESGWFGEELNGFETLQELNDIAISSGRIGNVKVFETDGRSAMQQYARNYARQHGDAAFMEHFLEQGPEKYLRLMERYTTMAPEYRMEKIFNAPQRAQQAAVQVLSDAAKNSDRGLRAVDTVLSRLYGSLDEAVEALRNDVLPPQNVDELLSALDDALKAQVDAHTNYKAASEAFEAMLENVDGNSNYNLVVAERQVLSDSLEDLSRQRQRIEGMRGSKDRSLAVDVLLNRMREHDAKLAAHTRLVNDLSNVHEILPKLLSADNVTANELVDLARTARAKAGVDGVVDAVDVSVVVAEHGPVGALARARVKVLEELRTAFPEQRAVMAERHQADIKRATRVAQMTDEDVSGGLSSFARTGDGVPEDIYAYFDYVLSKISAAEYVRFGKSATMDAYGADGVGTGLVFRLKNAHSSIRSAQHPRDTAYALQDIWHAFISTEQFLDYRDFYLPYGIIPGDDVMDEILRVNARPMIVDALASGDTGRLEELRGTERVFGRLNGTDDLLGTRRMVVPEKVIRDALRRVDGWTKVPKRTKFSAFESLTGEQKAEFKAHLLQMRSTREELLVGQRDLSNELGILERERDVLVENAARSGEQELGQLRQALGVKSLTRADTNIVGTGKIMRTTFTPGMDTKAFEVEFRRIFEGHLDVEELWEGFREQNEFVLSWINDLNAGDGNLDLTDVVDRLRSVIDSSDAARLTGELIRPTTTGKKLLAEEGIKNLSDVGARARGEMQDVFDTLVDTLLQGVDVNLKRLNDTNIAGINRSIASLQGDLATRQMRIAQLFDDFSNLEPESYFAELPVVREFVQPGQSARVDFIKARREEINFMMEDDFYPVSKSAANHVENLKILAQLNGEQVDFGQVVFADADEWKRFIGDADAGANAERMRLIVAHAREAYGDNIGNSPRDLSTFDVADASDVEVLNWFMVYGDHVYGLGGVDKSTVFAEQGVTHMRNSALVLKYKQTEGYKYLRKIKELSADAEALNLQGVKTPEKSLDILVKSVAEAKTAGDKRLLDLAEQAPDTVDFDEALGRLRAMKGMAVYSDAELADDAMDVLGGVLGRSASAARRADAGLEGDVAQKTMQRLEIEVSYLESLRKEGLETAGTKGKLRDLLRVRNREIESRAPTVDHWSAMRAKMMGELEASRMDRAVALLGKTKEDYMAEGKMSQWKMRQKTLPQVLAVMVRDDKEKVTKFVRAARLADSKKPARMWSPTPVEEVAPRATRGQLEAFYAEYPIDQTGPNIKLTAQGVGDELDAYGVPVTAGARDIASPDFDEATTASNVFNDSGDLMSDFEPSGKNPLEPIARYATRDASSPFRAGVNEPTLTRGVDDGLTKLEQDLLGLVDNDGPALVWSSDDVGLSAAIVARDAADALVTQLNSNFDVAASLLDAGDPARVAALMDEMQGIAGTLSQARLPQRNARQAAAHQTVVEAREIVRRIGELKDVQEIDQVMRSMVVFDARIEAQFALLGPVEAEARLVQGMQDAIEGGGRLFASGEVIDAAGGGVGTIPPWRTRTSSASVIRDGWMRLGLNNDEYPGLLASPEFKELWDNVGRLEDPEYVRKLLYYTGDFTKFHKAFATLTPGFQVRNAIANAVTWTAGGVRLENMKLGTDLYRSWYLASKTGTLFDDWARTQSPELVDNLLLARKMVLGSGGGIFSDTFRDVKSFVHPSARKLAKVYDNKLIRMNMKFGQESDNYSRFVMAFDSATRGHDVGMGSARVKKFYFDYEDLSSVDKVMRQIVPFWLWTSRNLTLHMQNMWLNPKPYLIYESFKRNLRDSEGEEDRYPSPFMQEIGAFKLPIGEKIYAQPDFGFTRIQQQLNELAPNPLRYANNMNPLFRVPLEQALGENIFNKKKLDDVPTRLLEGLKGLAVPVGMSARLVNTDDQNRNNAWLSFFGSPVRSYK